MYYCRYLVTETHVRSPIVVEMYEPTDDIPGMFNVTERLSRIYFLRFDNAVDTFRHGIVRRFVVFGHADADMVFLEYGHIIVTAVLHSTVGVMYQFVQRYSTSLSNSHLKRLYTNGCTQGVGKYPSDYFVGVTIRNQMQVTYISSLQTDIGYVANPQFVSFKRNEAADKILPFVETVVGVCRVTWFGRRKHQLVTAKKLKETVPTKQIIPSIDSAKHQP